MCTVTLAYDKKNKQAAEQLAALLATGLFTQLPDEEEEFPGLDYSDPWLYEDYGNLSPLPINKDKYSLEELRGILMNDLNSGCLPRTKHA